MSAYDVFDMDAIVSSAAEFQTACNNWLRIADSIAKCGRSTILFGDVPEPYNVFMCDHFKNFKEVHYLHLYCNDLVRTKRLLARGGWTLEGIYYTNQKAGMYLQQAIGSNPPIPVIDTSIIPVSQAADLIKNWVLYKLN
ncbi:MAG: hypothetical protein K0S39_3615 [Paenibacillus sp.]|nr:hypothetical protein [Paenibacillus sp.]